MRTLCVRTFTLIDSSKQEIPAYAILSHTWDGDNELLFEDMLPDNLPGARAKSGYSKVYRACRQAKRDGLLYLWADTCCIDKRSSAELSEVINSMFTWYSRAKVCYVYLADVAAGPAWETEFRRSRWFTRAWTLQELIAPPDVQFYDQSWKFLGHLCHLVHLVSSITTMDVRLLRHKREPATYSIGQRMSWAAKREATRPEDIAYSLLGIFDVNMTMLYGEGTKAFERLQSEIIRVSTDHSIFAWECAHRRDDSGPRGVLATSPADFAHCGRIGRLSGLLPSPFQRTNRGLEIGLPLAKDPASPGAVLAMLDCYRSGDAEKPYSALELQPLPKLLNLRNARCDPALFAAHVRDAYLVIGLRHLTETGFKEFCMGFKAEQIALFGGEDFRTMNLFTPGQPWMTPAAKYTRG